MAWLIFTFFGWVASLIVVLIVALWFPSAFGFMWIPLALIPLAGFIIGVMTDD